MHADGVRRCCVWIHALYNYNTQQSSKHVHGVGGECDQAQEGSNCHYQLPSLLCFKLAATRTNEIRMNSHYECRAVYTPPPPTHTNCVPMYCTCKQLSINTVVIIIHIIHMYTRGIDVSSEWSKCINTTQPMKTMKQALDFKSV